MAFAWDAGAMLSMKLQQGGYSLACIWAAVAPWMVLTGRHFLLIGEMLQHRMAGLRTALTKLQAATDGGSSSSGGASGGSGGSGSSKSSSSRGAVGGGSSSRGNAGGGHGSGAGEGSGPCDCVVCTCAAAAKGIALGCTDIATQALVKLQRDREQDCWLPGMASQGV